MKLVGATLSLCGSLLSGACADVAPQKLRILMQFLFIGGRATLRAKEAFGAICQARPYLARRTKFAIDVTTSIKSMCARRAILSCAVRSTVIAAWL
jgi:hypothetical protein